MSVGRETTQASSGLFIVQEKYELLPIIEGPPRWVLACLMDAGCSESEWSERYGGAVEYPSAGFYFPTDIICRPGAIPDEDITAEAVAALRGALGATHPVLFVRDAIERRIQSAEAENERRVADAVENAMLSPDPPRNRVITYGG